jgi:bifunctional DNA-binding transcriptional regulator/antitoxin component of YhaV-PrlF toxin-antitoxin module
MAKIRLEKQRQLTLPMEIVEQAGIRQHDMLEATYENGAIILRPIRNSERGGQTRSIMDYAGSCKGAWGNTLEEVEANLAEDRSSWDR